MRKHIEKAIYALRVDPVMSHMRNAISQPIKESDASSETQNLLLNAAEAKRIRKQQRNIKNDQNYRNISFFKHKGNNYD